MNRMFKRVATVSLTAVMAMSMMSGCILKPIDTDGIWLVSKRIAEDGEVNTARDLEKAGVFMEFDIDGEDVTYTFYGFGEPIKIYLKLNKTGHRTYDFSMGPGINFVQVTFDDEDHFWYESENENGGTVTYWFEREE